MTDPSQRAAARIAGAAIPISFFVLAFSTFALLDPLRVSGDAATTARAILANEATYRLGVIGQLLYAIGQVATAGALLVLLRPAGRTLATLASAFRLVWAIAWIPIAVDSVTALRILEDTVLSTAFGEQQTVLLAGLHMNGYDIYYVGLPFWAISATLMSWALLRGGIVPRWLALVGVAAAAWCVFCSIGHFVEPGFVNVWVYDTALALFELVLAGWLLFGGARTARVDSTSRLQE